MILRGRIAWGLLGALLLSLCVNLFAAGHLSGRWFGDDRSRAWTDDVRRLVASGGTLGTAAGGLGLGMGDLRGLDGVPADARPHLRDALRERRVEFVRRARALGEARRAMAEAASGDPFDAPRFARTAAELRASSSDLQEVVQAGLADALARMPADARRQLAEQLTRRGGRRGP